MTCACSSYGVTSTMIRIGSWRKNGITWASNCSHVSSTSILGLLKKRSRRRSILLAFASLSANSAESDLRKDHTLGPDRSQHKPRQGFALMTMQLTEKFLHLLLPCFA